MAKRLRNHQSLKIPTRIRAFDVLKKKQGKEIELKPSRERKMEFL
jgi:hypothetical protein